MGPNKRFNKVKNTLIVQPPKSFKGRRIYQIKRGY